MTTDRTRAHVLHDIDPFVCLFEDCVKPDKLYKTSNRWLKHLQDHRMTWSCMKPMHSHLQFATQEALRSYLQSAHSKNLSMAPIDMLLNRGLRPLGAIFANCPLCGQVSGDDKAPERQLATISVPSYDDNKLLHKHIENHLHELALLSLLPVPDVGDSSNPTGAGGRPSLHSIAFSEMDLGTGDLFSASDDVPRNLHALVEHLPDAESAGQVPGDFFDDNEADKMSKWRDYVLDQQPPPDISEDDEVSTELDKPIVSM